jgi:Bacteriophage head to tail connecting protein
MAIGTSTGLANHPSGLTPRQRYEVSYQALKTVRATFDDHWQELAEFFLPRRSRFSITDVDKGDRRSRSIIDSEPTFAARTLQHGLHAGLTSPARPWFKLTTPDPDLAEFQSVKEWLHLVTTRMQTVFLKSNLYQALPSLYGDLGVFGTAAMGWLEDDKSLLRAYTYPIGSYVLGLDERGVVATFAREFQMTVEQLVGTFGVRDRNKPWDVDWSVFSDPIKDHWDKSEYHTRIDVCWYVAPNREDYKPRSLRAAQALPFKSCYFEIGRADESYSRGRGKAQFLRESGFRDFPIFAPRWEVTGEDTYATSGPGIIGLGDAKQLQVMQKRKGQAIEKSINPSLKAPASAMQTKVSLLPGGVTWVDDPTGRALSPIHEVRLEGLQFMQLDMQETRNRVDRAFYADLFLMLQQADALGANQQRTAREIEERHEEKLLALGPVLERLNDELLDPLIDRTFAAMLDAGLVPPPPEELEGMELRVEYLSVMAQAQKLAGASALDRYVQTALVMAEALPEALHKVDALQVMDEYGHILGVPPRVIRTDEEAQARQQAQQQQQAQLAEAAALKDQAAATAHLAKAPVNGGETTALDAMLAAQHAGGVTPTAAPA